MDHAVAEQEQAHGIARGLDLLWLEITQKCNLSCQHCYVSSGPALPLHNRMTHGDWCDVISAAARLGCSSLQFIGGEPLLYRRINELIQVAKDAGYATIEVYTNGTPITDVRARHLAANRVRVACSLYSDNARVHDAVTNVPGSYYKTVTALERLVSHGVDVRVGFIEMDTNAGEFEATKSFLATLSIENVGYDKVRGFGRGDEVKSGGARSESKFGDLCGQCWKGKLCVTNSGDAYPCIMGRSFGVGNVLDAGLAPVAEGAALERFRREMSSEQRSRAARRAELSKCIPNETALDPCNPGLCGPDQPPCRPENTPCSPDHPCNPTVTCAPDRPCGPKPLPAGANSLSDARSYR